MDPLSLITSIITLVQVVVELVDLAKALREAFSQVSQNHNKAQKLLDNVLVSTTFIQTFYGEHRALLEESDAKPLLDILLSLRDSLTSVLSDCKKLMPEQRTGRLGKAKAAWHSIFRAQELEDRINGLWAQTERSRSQFIKKVWETTMRLEMRTSEIHQHVVIRQRTPVPTADIPEHCRAFTVTLPRFAISLPLTAPPASPQIFSFRTSLPHPRLGGDFHPKPNDFEMGAQQIMTLRPTVSYERLQQHLASQTADLCSILLDLDSLSPNALLRASDYLLRISERFHDTLCLPQEATTLSSWAISFYRRAYEAYPETYRKPVANGLVVLSSQLIGRPGEEVMATTNIVDALRLHREALSIDPSPVNKVDLGRALTLSSCIAQQARDDKTSKENIREAIDLLQAVLMDAYGTLSVGDISLNPESFKESRTVVQVDDWRVLALLAYGHALVQLGTEEGLTCAHRIFLAFHGCLPGAFSTTLLSIAHSRALKVSRGQYSRKIQYLKEALIHLAYIPTAADDIRQDALKYWFHMEHAFYTAIWSPLSTFTVVDAYELARPLAERITKALTSRNAAKTSPELLNVVKDTFGSATSTEVLLLERMGLRDLEGKWSLGTERIPYSSTSICGKHSLEARLAAIRDYVDDILNKAQEGCKGLTDVDYNTTFTLCDIAYSCFVQQKKFEDADHVGWGCVNLIRYSPHQYRVRDENRLLLLGSLSSLSDSDPKRTGRVPVLPLVEDVAAVTRDLFLTDPILTRSEWNLVGNILEGYRTCVEFHGPSAGAVESLERYLKWCHRAKPVTLGAANETVLGLAATLAQCYLSAGRWTAALNSTASALETILDTGWRAVDRTSEVNCLCVAVVIMHATALQHLGRVIDAIGCLKNAGHHFSDGYAHCGVPDAVVVEERSDPREAPEGGGDEGAVRVPENSGVWDLEFVPPWRGETRSPGKESSSRWDLCLLSLQASLLLQKGEALDATALASDALGTIKPPHWIKVTYAPKSVASVYLQTWLDFARTFADGGSPAKAMHYTCRAMGVVEFDLCHNEVSALVYSYIDSGIVLASTALLHNLHIEDASTLLLQQVGMCEDHIPQRGDLYILFAVAMRLLAFYHCGVGNHAEGKKWKRKVVGLEDRLEEAEGPNGEVFGAVKRRIIWEEGRPSTQEIKKILNIRCKHQGPVFAADDDE